MNGIYALGSLPSPSGGAVRLSLHTPIKDLYALVLASTSPDAPDPVMQDGARKIAGGKVRARMASRHFAGCHEYLLMDLDSDALTDGETVYYHAYELHPDGSYGPPLTVSAVPGCVRDAVVVIARDVVKRRLRYHMRRAVADGVVVGVHEIPVLEMEVREEGQPLPAIFVKERVNPNPAADTVGHHGGQHRTDAHNPNGVKEFRYAYTATVDMLLLCDNPDTRTELEAYIRGVLDADRELWLAAGIEAPQVSAFTRHDVDDAAGTDAYSSEISLSGQVATVVREEVATTQQRLSKRS